jgi:hypothetical protein
MAFLHYSRDPWSRVPAMKIEESKLPFHYLPTVLDPLFLSYVSRACQGKLNFPKLDVKPRAILAMSPYIIYCLDQ